MVKFEDFTQAIELNPNWADAYEGLRLALDARGW
jgi:hypothetical protein